MFPIKGSVVENEDKCKCHDPATFDNSFLGMSLRRIENQKSFVDQFELIVYSHSTPIICISNLPILDTAVQQPKTAAVYFSGICCFAKIIEISNK